MLKDKQRTIQKKGNIIMDGSVGSFARKKYISILLMGLAFLMLNLSWIKFSDNNLDFVKELRDAYEEDMEMMESFYGDNLEEALKNEGYSDEEVDRLVSMANGTEKILDTLETGRYSVWSAVSMMSALSDVKANLTHESTVGMESASKAASAINAFQTFFGIIIGVFAVVGLFMVLTIISHIRNKDSMGVAAMVFSIIMAVVFGFFGLIVRFGINEPGNGVTLAPILMPIFTIASCVVWSSARKNMPRKEMGNLY